MAAKYHRAFGVYGIMYQQEKLIVIKKHGGPYTNRYDLPGGSLEDGEKLETAIVREIQEETGFTALEAVQVGITSFRYPWDYQEWHFNQHLCVFYQVKQWQGQLQETVKQFAGQDSLGAVAVSLEQLNLENSSPLVLKAKEFLQNDQKFNSADQTFSSWPVLTKAVY
ncbi:NUDIX hydrolase [Lactobacillus sp. ESL0679]|uniref:NUDIX hydrolase n=1 Tax=Lactobacillus sp. ESL0679 TaxID=2983209 RepID=UPI0023F85FFE|nr:NUDIX hydrolase [Lactobacillus sp. ESL0679]MDF7682733.1 NUDIX hydrolase [Lactobacillus sp. ESL0679]